MLQELFNSDRTQIQRLIKRKGGVSIAMSRYRYNYYSDIWPLYTSTPRNSLYVKLVHVYMKLFLIICAIATLNLLAMYSCFRFAENVYLCVCIQTFYVNISAGKRAITYTMYIQLYMCSHHEMCEYPPRVLRTFRHAWNVRKKKMTNTTQSVDSMMIPTTRSTALNGLWMS